MAKAFRTKRDDTSERTKRRNVTYAEVPAQGLYCRLARVVLTASGERWQDVHEETSDGPWLGSVRKNDAGRWIAVSSSGYSGAHDTKRKAVDHLRAKYVG